MTAFFPLSENEYSLDIYCKEKSTANALAGTKKGLSQNKSPWLNG